uniref:Uncharacterized protein n=1 Tax=Arundo donax TaxID=35708 RepID=A0A0A8Y4Q7_ARUDO
MRPCPRGFHSAAARSASAAPPSSHARPPLPLRLSHARSREPASPPHTLSHRSLSQLGRTSLHHHFSR